MDFNAGGRPVLHIADGHHILLRLDKEQVVDRHREVAATDVAVVDGNQVDIGSPSESLLLPPK